MEKTWRKKKIKRDGKRKRNRERVQRERNG